MVGHNRAVSLSADKKTTSFLVCVYKQSKVLMCLFAKDSSAATIERYTILNNLTCCIGAPILFSQLMLTYGFLFVTLYTIYQDMNARVKDCELRV